MRLDVVKAAQTHLGKRWRHQGRGPDALDCVGLVVQTARTLGVEGEDFTTYKKGGVLSPDMLSYLTRAGFAQVGGDPKPGQLAILRSGPYPCHMGIIGSPWTLIHAHARAGVVREEPLEPWRDKIVALFDFPGSVCYNPCGPSRPAIPNEASQ